MRQVNDRSIYSINGPVPFSTQLIDLVQFRTMVNAYERSLKDTVAVPTKNAVLACRNCRYGISRRPMVSFSGTDQ